MPLPAFKHAFNANWILSADYTLETGKHGYRRYGFSNVAVLPPPTNRSVTNALATAYPGQSERRLSSSRQIHPRQRKNVGGHSQLGELFDYGTTACALTH